VGQASFHIYKSLPPKPDWGAFFRIFAAAAKGGAYVSPANIYQPGCGFGNYIMAAAG